VSAGKFANNVDAIRKAFANRERLKIGVEASCRAFWIADGLKELGHEVVVDPGRTKAIGAARIKHDKLDARPMLHPGYSRQETKSVSMRASVAPPVKVVALANISSMNSSPTSRPCIARQLPPMPMGTA